MIGRSSVGCKGKVMIDPPARWRMRSEVCDRWDRQDSSCSEADQRALDAGRAVLIVSSKVHRGVSGREGGMEKWAPYSGPIPRTTWTYPAPGPPLVVPRPRYYAPQVIRRAEGIAMGVMGQHHVHSAPHQTPCDQGIRPTMPPKGAGLGHGTVRSRSSDASAYVGLWAVAMAR